MPGWRVKQREGSGDSSSKPNPAPDRLRDLRQPLPWPELLFPGGFKGPFHLRKVPSSPTPGERLGSGVPCMLSPYILLRKLRVWDSVFLSTFLSSCSHCPLLGLMYPRKATISDGVKLLILMPSSPSPRLPGIYHSAQFTSPAGDRTHGPMHARQTLYLLRHTRQSPSCFLHS